jgi:hypothetical protein
VVDFTILFLLPFVAAICASVALGFFFHPPARPQSEVVAQSG